MRWLQHDFGINSWRQRGSPENQDTEGLTFCSLRVPCRELAELRVKVAISASITNRLDWLALASCAAGAGAGAKPAVVALPSVRMDRKVQAGRSCYDLH